MAKTVSKKAKTSKKSNRRIDFNSRKVQVLVVAIFFAAIGGIYYLQRSNAQATSVSINASVLTSNTVSDAAKNNTSVARVPANGELKWDIPGNKMKIGAQYRICASARAEQGTSTRAVDVNAAQIKGARLSSDSLSTTGTYALTTNWTTICSPYFKGFGRDTLRTKIKNNSNRTIRVGAIFLDKK